MFSGPETLKPQFYKPHMYPSTVFHSISKIKHVRLGVWFMFEWQGSTAVLMLLMVPFKDVKVASAESNDLQILWTNSVFALTTSSLPIVSP